MDILRMNSKYDLTKRTYEVPLFAIRDKRVSHASRFFSPQQATLINSRAISERKFMMTQLGASHHKPDNRIT
jgi:predicted nucleic acid binding AN1-type Zn finger protein